SARQLPQPWEVEEEGVRAGEIVRPLRAAGCYVPGGRASYPSSVAMTVVPARVAGVEEIFVCTPPGPDGSILPAVLYAPERAGARLIAADLVTQAEHDPEAVAVFVTTDASHVEPVRAAVEEELLRADRREIIEQSLATSRAVVVFDLNSAAEVVNDIAPEHL